MFKFDGDHPGVLSLFPELLAYSTIPWSQDISNIPAHRITVVNQMLNDNMKEFTNKKIPVNIDFSFRAPFILCKMRTTDVSCRGPAIDMGYFFFHNFYRKYTGEYNFPVRLSV